MSGSVTAAICMWEFMKVTGTMRQAVHSENDIDKPDLTSHPIPGLPLDYPLVLKDSSPTKTKSAKPWKAHRL